MTVCAAPGILQVVAGKDADLELLVKGSHPDGTPASFKVMKAADHSVLDTIDGQVKKGRATTKWTARGPDETGQARSHRVYYEVTVKNEKTTSGELEVYHDALEVTSQQEDGSPYPDARFELKLKGLAQCLAGGSTGSGGVFTVTGLPVGELEVQWESPASEASCVERTAKKYKAKLKANPRAALVWPAPGAHQQWVNHKASPKQPAHGHTLRVRVGVKKADGPSRAGQELFCKLEYPPADQRSKRDDPRPGFVSGVDCAAVASKKVDKDGGEVVFEVELGLAGGDKVTIKVGGTQACADEQVEVTNWRRVYYQLTRPDFLEPYATERAEERLAEDGFVVYERWKEVVFKREELPAEWKGSAQLGTDFGVTDADRKDKTFLLAGAHLDDWLTGKADGAKGKLGLDVSLVNMLVDAIDDAKALNTTRVTATLTTAEQEVPLPAGHVVFPKSLDDGAHPFISGSWWKAGDAGNKRPLTRDAVKIEKAGSKVKLVLPRSLPDDAGCIVGDGAAGHGPKIQVEVKLKAPTRPYLGAAWGQHQMVTMRHTGAEQVFNDTLAHELGHALKQAADGAPPGLTVGDHAHAYTGHGHEGEHCWHGLDAAGATHVAKTKADGTVEHEALAGDAHAQPDYSKLRKQSGAEFEPVAGDCIMYGAGPSKDPSRMTAGFCEQCRPFLRGQALEEIGT